MKTAIVHYSAAPVVGGVETVIEAHARQFAAAGMPLTVIAGRGEAQAMPQGVNFELISEMDSQNSEIVLASEALNRGEMPDSFEPLTARLTKKLRPLVSEFDLLIVHNIFTKHFNLPLTAALFRLLDDGAIAHAVAWCHDLSWSSEHSRIHLHPGYPWDLLRTAHQNVTYVAISEQRKKEVVLTFSLNANSVKVIYSGVDPVNLYGLSEEGATLIERMELLSADLILIMPVRITEAKNIELAIRTAAILREQGVSVKIVVTGPPDPHDEASLQNFRSLQELRRSLHVDSDVRFVYESGPKPNEGYLLTEPAVAELYRMADALLMPSHREGFGMPILEAGLLGLPIFSTPVPAVNELAQNEVVRFEASIDPGELAERIVQWMEANPVHALKAKIRQNHTWESVFKKGLLPLLEAVQAYGR